MCDTPCPNTAISLTLEVITALRSMIRLRRSTDATVSMDAEMAALVCPAECAQANPVRTRSQP